MRAVPAAIVLALMGGGQFIFHVPSGGKPAGYYTTMFAATENPISESSVWTNGLATGLDWCDVQTGSGSAYGTCTSAGPPYSDPTAILTGTWSANQWAAATVKISGNQGDTGSQEIELRLRSLITAHTNSGYECEFSVRNNDYADIVRWNGSLNDFTPLAHLASISATLGRAMVDGDVIACEVQGTTITAYVSGVQVLTTTDSTFSSGNPGIGFFFQNPTTTTFSDGALKDFTASDGNLFPITVANTTPTNVQNAINSAVDGDTVLLPPGSFTWTSGVSISGKGIQLRGAGSGRIVGRSTSSVAVGTGTKTFTLNASGLDILSGQTLRIQWFADTSGWPGTNPDGRATFMQGTVTSYSGTTLTMNITSTGGSGTHADWLVGSSSATTITNNYNGNILNLTEDATYSVRVNNFKIAAGTATAATPAANIEISGVTNGKPVKIHDMWLEGANNMSVFHMSVNRGLFWNLSIDASPFASSALAWHVQPDTETTSWSTASTWGAADTTGTRNIWIEDCDIHNFLNATDFDDNARAVIRYTLLHQTSIGSHGQDTSLYGVRTIELHNDTFLAASESGGYPINQWVVLRGGSMLITDSAVPDLRPGEGKPEITLGIYMLREAESNNPCWGQDIPGIQYPGPRQVGFGYVTGTGVDGLGNSTYNGVYVGDSEPIYYWNNTGIATPVVSVDDTSDGGCTGSLDSGSDYVISGRDYFINAGAKPGYTKYTYPHPLRAVR